MSRRRALLREHRGRAGPLQQGLDGTARRPARPLPSRVATAAASPGGKRVPSSLHTCIPRVIRPSQRHWWPVAAADMLPRAAGHMCACTQPHERTAPAFCSVSLSSPAAADVGISAQERRFKRTTSPCMLSCTLRYCVHVCAMEGQWPQAAERRRMPQAAASSCAAGLQAHATTRSSSPGVAAVCCASTRSASKQARTAVVHRLHNVGAAHKLARHVHLRRPVSIGIGWHAGLQGSRPLGLQG